LMMRQAVSGRRGCQAELTCQRKEGQRDTVVRLHLSMSFAVAEAED
jgi:hypothetical protein